MNSELGTWSAECHSPSPFSSNCGFFCSEFRVPNSALGRVDGLGGGSFPLASTGVLLRSTGALSAAGAADAVFLHVNRPRPSPFSATPSERPRLETRNSGKEKNIAVVLSITVPEPRIPNPEARLSVSMLVTKLVCRSSKLEKYCHACACRHLRKQNK